MKKVLSAVAALGMIGGFAATASAVDVKLSGSYELNGYMYDKGDGTGVVLTKTTPEATSDAFLMHTFRIKPVLVINDKLKMVSNIYLAYDTMWGQDDTGSVFEDGNNFEVRHLFMEYKSGLGQIRAGRHLANPFGTWFLNSERTQDRLMWWPSFMASGGFKTLLFYAKVQENDGVAVTSDADWDYYEARVMHKSSNGDMVAGLGWNRKAEVATQIYDKYRFKISGSYNFGSMYLNSELHYDWGTNNRDTLPDVDLSTIAFMADVGVKTGKINAGALVIYASGDDNATADGEMSAALTSGQGNNGLGEDFQPYYILTGPTTGLFNPQVNGLHNTAATAGIVSIGAHADFQLTEALSLHGAVAYAMAESAPTGYDDEYGLELNLGMGYKLLDNLTYEVHAGYLMTGDFFTAAGTQETEDVMLLSHHLTMEF